MSENSKIEWTDSTWNPLRARIKGSDRWGFHCEHAGEGCRHCYAESMNSRKLPAWGTGLKYNRQSRDLVDTFFDQQELMKPLRWRKPRKIFPCSMTDLFGEWVPDEIIDKAFAVMALCRQHTFICLTKRGKRMREYFAPGTFRDAKVADWAKRLHTSVVPFALPSETIFDARRVARGEAWEIVKWPLPNVILGVSGSTQDDLEKQVPELLRTPATCRLLSLEPQVEDVDPANIGDKKAGVQWDSLTGEYQNGDIEKRSTERLNWVIQGGESGHGARPFDLAWARKTRDQCEAAGVPYFLKQVGSRPIETHWRFGHEDCRSLQLRDRKGGDPAEWHADLQDCRAFPELAR